MRPIFTLILLFLLVLNVNSQTNKSTVNKNSFKHAERLPVYKGCDSTETNAILKKCMSDKISRHVAKYFNQSLAANLNLKPGEVNVFIIFKISTDGLPIEIRAKAPHRKLVEEAIRVIKLMPKFERPGLVDGEPVIVPYSLPMKVVIPKPKKKRKRIYEKQ